MPPGNSGAVSAAAGVPFPAFDHVLSPRALTARTCTEYSTPLASPVMVWVRCAGSVTSCVPTGSSQLPSARTQRSAYFTIALPPSSGAVHDAVSSVSPTLTAGAAGRPGAVAGVALMESDAGPSPTLFTARTWNVYSVPLSRPVTVWLVVSGPLPLMSVQLP